MDTTVGEHTEHFTRLNGSLDKVAASLIGIEKHISSQRKVDEVLQAVEANRRKFNMWFAALAVTIVLAVMSTLVSIAIAAVLILTS